MSDVVIDVSHYDNVSQDFVTTAKTPDANGNTIVAVILKATQGTDFVDPTFLSRVGEAKAAANAVAAKAIKRDIIDRPPCLNASKFLRARPRRPACPAVVHRPSVFSILSSVNSFNGASSLRSTIRASGRASIQSPTVE